MTLAERPERPERPERSYATFDEALQAAERLYRETGEDCLIEYADIRMDKPLPRPWKLAPFPRPVKADG